MLIIIGAALLLIGLAMPSRATVRYQSASEAEALRRERLSGRAPTPYVGPTFNAHGRIVESESGNLTLSGAPSSSLRRI